MPRSSIKEKEELKDYITDLVRKIQSGKEQDSIEAALIIMFLAFKCKTIIIPYLIDSLIKMLDGSALAKYAASWALYWLSQPSFKTREVMWKPDHAQMDKLIQILGNSQTEKETIVWICRILGNSKDSHSVEA